MRHSRRCAAQWERSEAASREAAARRFVELHPDDLAVVFCKNSRLVYAACGRDFPCLSLLAGAQCDLGRAVQGTISSVDEVAPDDWLHAPQPACELSAQTLWQAKGYSITLLRADQFGDGGGYTEYVARTGQETPGLRS